MVGVHEVIPDEKVHVVAASKKSLRFTASLCPAQEARGGGATTCELPFGFVWSPFREDSDDDDDDTDTTTRTATIAAVDDAILEVCPTCLAYRNVYTNCDATTTNASNEWICSFCHSTVVNDPTKEMATPNTTNTIYRQPVTTTALPAIPTLVLVLDGHLPVPQVQAIGALVESLIVTTTKPMNIGLIVFDDVVSVYELPMARGLLASCQEFRDYTATCTVNSTCSSNGRTDNNNNNNTNGMTAYENDVITDEAPYLWTVEPTASSTAGLLDPLWTCLAARFGFALEDTRNDHHHNDTYTHVKEQNKPLSRLEQLKQAKAARLLRDGASKHTTRTTMQAWSSPSSTSQTTRQRCTADAIHCAAELLSSGDRLWLFTNGCPTRGPGNCCAHDENGATNQIDPHRVTATAIPYFSALGDDLLDGVLTDVFLFGNNPLAVPVYQALVEASSGYAIVAPEPFSKEALLHNGRHVYQRTRASLGQYFAPSSSVSSASSPTTPETNGSHHQQQPHTGAWIEGCTADIRLSSCLTATHLIGPGELVDEELRADDDGFSVARRILVNEQASVDAARRRTVAQYPQQQQHRLAAPAVLRVQLGRYDPLSTFSVMLQWNEDHTTRYKQQQVVYVQVVIRYVHNQTLITRVRTQQLPVAGTVGEFLHVVDQQVVPVVLAKEAVYRSMIPDTSTSSTTTTDDDIDRLAYDAQKDLDQTIFQISAAFRLLSLEHGTKSVDLTEDGGTKVASTSMDFAFPPELSEALRRLYHMRRGPFLSPGPLQSVDDRAALRAFFVRFPLEECLAMMAPELWSSGPLEAATKTGIPLYDSVPPSTLSLWENRIIAADHWNSLFIWSGGSVDDSTNKYKPMVDHFCQFLRSRSQDRFPAPSLHILSQSDSMSRRFTALLAPLHGDPLEHQLAHFTALADLSTADRDRLLARFRFYDPEADPSFRKWFWQVVSAAHGGQPQGLSLCD